MKISSYARMVVACAVGLALAATAPVPATAAGDPTWPDTANCAVGGFTGHVTGPSGGTRPYLELSGWVGPCAPSDKDPEPSVSGRFGFAYMNFPWMPAPGKDPRGGLLYNERLRFYESATGTTAFAGQFDFELARTNGEPEMPICLISDTTSKLSCVVVELDGTVPSVTPVEVTDPRVRGGITFARKGGGTTPNCGTCL